MNEPRVVVSALIERAFQGKKQVFVQTRNKNSSPNYSGMLEIPAGGVEPYEHVFAALKREIYEETGLSVTKIINEEVTEICENRKGDTSIAFRPYVCQQVLSSNDGLPWIGFVFRCEVEGSVNANIHEALDPRWINLDELSNFLENNKEQVFSLQYATLKKYLQEIHS